MRQEQAAARCLETAMPHRDQTVAAREPIPKVGEDGVNVDDKADHLRQPAPRLDALRHEMTSQPAKCEARTSEVEGIDGMSA